MAFGLFIILGGFTSSCLGNIVNTHLWVPVWLTGVQIISSYLKNKIYEVMTEQSTAQEKPSVKDFWIFPPGFQTKGGNYVDGFIATILHSSCDCQVPFSPSQSWQRVISPTFNLTNALGDCSITFFHTKIKTVLPFPWAKNVFFLATFCNSNVFYCFLLFQELWICIAYFPSSIVVTEVSKHTTWNGWNLTRFRKCKGSRLEQDPKIHEKRVAVF